MAQAAWADSGRTATSQGNKLYQQGKFNKAISRYDQALVDAPQSLEPKFDKANSYYKLDDLAKAMDLYKQVATKSKDMTLVAKAKYNLGNTYFQQGAKQKDSNLRKAIEDMETAISSWRGTLDIQPHNTRAARNIEVARLTIKDLLDQLNKQKKQHDPNQPQNKNQQSQKKQQKQGSRQASKQSQGQKKQQQASAGEPNKPQEPNRPKKQTGQGRKKQKQMAAPDATAQQILDREQQQRKQRQIVQRGTWQKVDQDW
jgi:Ca-activated chloride channel homolog